MAWDRGYVRRLRTDSLPWFDGALLGRVAEGTQVRILSKDAVDGAVTCMWRLPAGWSLQGGHALAGGESMFVLQGEVTVGERRFGPRCFGYRPAHTARDALATRDGTVLLMMWDASPALVEPAEATASDDGTIFIDTGATPARPTFVDGPVPGITVKVLRQVPETGGMTLLVSIPPGWHEPRAEHHDCIEESFKLEGDMRLVENGIEHTLLAGDYFFRPPRIKHGPMWTTAGTTSLIRFSATVVNHYGPV